MRKLRAGGKKWVAPRETGRGRVQPKPTSSESRTVTLASDWTHDVCVCYVFCHMRSSRTHAEWQRERETSTTKFSAVLSNPQRRSCLHASIKPCHSKVTRRCYPPWPSPASFMPYRMVTLLVAWSQATSNGRRPSPMIEGKCYMPLSFRLGKFLFHLVGYSVDAWCRETDHRELFSTSWHHSLLSVLLHKPCWQEKRLWPNKEPDFWATAWTSCALP